MNKIFTKKYILYQLNWAKNVLHVKKLIAKNQQKNIKMYI